MNNNMADSYKSAQPNQPLAIYSGEMTLSDGRDVVLGTGAIALRWLPSPDVNIKFKSFSSGAKSSAFLAMRQAFGARSGITLSLPNAPRGVVFSVNSASSNSAGDYEISGRLGGMLEMGDPHAIRAAMLHVVNMRAYYDLGASEPDLRLSPSFVLQDSKWKIRLAAISKVDDAINVIEETGGFGVTHTLSVQKIDDTTFTSSDLDDLNLALYYFLTFVEGRIVHAILPIGFATDEQQIWASCSPWHIDGWKSVMSWVDRHYGGAIPSTFPGFMAKWNDEEWRQVLTLVIQWYAAANRNESGLENGIVSAAIALDAIAWQILVIEHKVLSAHGFKSLSAADKLRLMCGYLKIPLSFYSSFNELKRKAAGFNWFDCADAIATVRNNIVHPDAKLRAQLFDDRTLFETWLSALWMLEMSLLRIFGFEGGYSDRRSIPSWVGTLTTTPWSQP